MLMASVDASIVAHKRPLPGSFIGLYPYLFSLVLFRGSGAVPDPLEVRELSPIPPRSPLSPIPFRSPPFPLLSLLSSYFPRDRADLLDVHCHGVGLDPVEDEHSIDLATADQSWWQRAYIGLIEAIELPLGDCPKDGHSNSPNLNGR